MAKFIKSFFQSEKKVANHEDGSDEEHPPPLESRRKLSVSRSGRMKHAQKKRRSLTLEIYGDDNLKSHEKPKSREYRVHPMSAPISVRAPTVNTKVTDNEAAKIEINQNIGKQQVRQRKTPEEEEIDIAFEIIEKS